MYVVVVWLGVVSFLRSLSVCSLSVLSLSVCSLSARAPSVCALAIDLASLYIPAKAILSCLRARALVNVSAVTCL